MADIVALLALAATLTAAIVRPAHAPESVVALVAAALCVAAGAVSAGDAADEARTVGPTLALLAALLVLGEGCRRAGLFSALADRLARGARARGRTPMHHAPGQLGEPAPSGRVRSSPRRATPTFASINPQ
jgi:Na+/H+ antiporter NhaD/arsenite permease-like protein